MKIEHLALWTVDLERMIAFYTTYFGARAGRRYQSATRPFRSCFLTFADGARLELMATPDVVLGASEEGAMHGYAHLALSVGSREAVDALTERLRADGHRVLSGPRTTGDGYYESVVADPDGNPVEITE
jgi:lactoylglutathione lyase